MSNGTKNSSMLFNSKARSSTGGSWQRRRFTKSAATVDGQYDPDLALAIQESLKQAEMDALKAKENQSDTLSKLENNVGKENRTRKTSNSSSTIELSNETQQLKDLVCVHMDLIQQQQDVINQKDKTIKTLRAENNALQCRLQRMERRMALLKQKEEMSGSTHIAASPPPKPGTMSYTEPIVSPFEKHSYKKKIETPVASATTPIQKRISETPKQCQTKTPTSALDINKTKCKESHRKRKLASVQNESISSDNKTLETNNLYYVSYYEPVSEQVEVDSQSDILGRGAQSQMEVEVPTFKVKQYANLYAIEGTEDHEDDTFMRRHQRPEIEEKRRKRWDDQRLREEIMLERLREKQESKHKHRKPEDPVESFFPCLDDITHIEVLDKVPVTAFGQPIPYSRQESFSLPWSPRLRSASSSQRHRQK